MQQFFDLAPAEQVGAFWWDYASDKVPEPHWVGDIGLGLVDPFEYEVEIKVQSGKRMADFMGSTAMCPLVSPEFVETLRAIDATGWSATPPFKVRGKKAEGAQPLFFQVSGRAQRIEFDGVGVEWQYVPFTEGWAAFGIGLSVHGWDGSDVFMVEERGYVLCTRRVVDALRNAERTVKIVPVGEIRWTMSVEERDRRGLRAPSVEGAP